MSTVRLGKNRNLCTGRLNLRDQGTPKRFHEIRELKRLANKTSDLWYARCARKHLLAISAGQNHAYVRPDLNRFSNYLPTGGPGNGHVQQNHINLAPVRAKKVDCKR